MSIFYPVVGCLIVLPFGYKDIKKAWKTK